jgi:hypothetical protein
MFDSITQDGTFIADTFGNILNIAASLTTGFVVAIKPVEDEAEVTPGTIFGRWEDSATGRVFWDLVEVVDNIGDALLTASNRGELAIWDLAKSEEIRIS